MSSPFMSISEAAEYFRVSESTIRNARGDFARLAHVHIGKRHLVTRESAEQLAADILSRAQSVEDAVNAGLSKGRKRSKTGLAAAA